MDHSIVYKEQAPPAAHDLFHPVTTALICQNTLLRKGIGHILSGTRFVLSEDVCEDASDLPVFSTAPDLFLICENRRSDEYAETIRRLKARYPSARVVIFADQMEPRAIIQVCQAGVDGLCSTTMNHDALIKALGLVMLGETFLSAGLSLPLLDQMASGSHAAVAPAPVNDLSSSSRLSAREAQILRCLMQGSSNKLIARDLGVAEATVKVHIKTILRKVKVANRTQAAMWAQQNLAAGAQP
jgi:two-component system, NarL family, nitrate/nitrite response regulator NarL